MNPSEFEIDSLKIDSDLNEYAKSDKSYFVALIKQGKRPIRATLDAELATEGINSMTFENGPSHSFGITLKDEDDEKALKSFIDMIKEDLDNAKLKKWTITPLSKDDSRIFIKLTTDKTKKRIITRSNLKLDPRKIEELDVYRGQGVTVSVDVGVWYNFKTTTAGLFLKPTRVDFEQDEPAPKKRK